MLTHLTNIFPYWAHQCHTNPYNNFKVIQLKLTDVVDAKMQINIFILTNIPVNNHS